MSLPKIIIDSEEILKLNSEWWNSPQKRNTQMKIYEHTDVKFPTNYLTTYTYDEIGIPEISELNKYCISLNGQPSTVEGIDTSISYNKLEPKIIFQREYLTFAMQNKHLAHFMYHFQPKRQCMIIIETINTKNLIPTKIWYNSFTNQFINTDDDIWLTANQYETNEISYPTILPLKYGYYTDFKSDIDNNFIQFDYNTFSDINNFTIIYFSFVFLIRNLVKIKKQLFKFNIYVK